MQDGHNDLAAVEATFHIIDSPSLFYRKSVLGCARLLCCHYQTAVTPTWVYDPQLPEALAYKFGPLLLQKMTGAEVAVTTQEKGTEP